MSKSSRRIVQAQLNIFDLIQEVSQKQAEAAAHPQTAGKASIDAAVRHLITDALKRCLLDRYEVAAKMSSILGVEITKAQLDSWSAESKENHRFPYIYIGAFCQASGCKALARYMAELCGGYFIEGEDAIRLELGKIEEEKADIANRERAIRAYLERLHGR
ncbi:MAG: hypothetical protein M0024_01505 [Nitrospiraceae bacterium]|nr:hypothetical protein [Nitrospiraceae bacterium]